METKSSSEPNHGRIRQKRESKVVLVLGFILALMMPLPAGSQELVVNGGFAVGGLEFLEDFGFDPGWTWEGEPLFGGYVNERGSAQGGVGSWLAPEGTLYQDLQTVPGETYVLSFAAQGFEHYASWKTSLLRVQWGDQILADYALPRMWNWNYYNFVVVASNSVTRLLVTGSSNPSIDDFSVTPVPDLQPIIDLTGLEVRLGPTNEFMLRVTTQPYAPGYGVSSVDFIVGGFDVVGSVAAPPYTFTWTNVSAGDHFISALVTDNLGYYTMSAGTHVRVDFSTVVGPPFIITHPSSRTNNTGTAASLTVAAAGTKPLCYRWSFNGVEMLGETNATLTLTNLNLSQAGRYAVMVTNSLDSVVSIDAVLTVVPAPPCVPAPSKLVGWWRADGNAFDSAGVNHGQPAGNLQFGLGEMGAFLGLDGMDASLKVPASPLLNVGQSDGFTIEAWIKPSTIDYKQPIVEWNDGGSGIGVGFWLSQGGIGNGRGCLFANLPDPSGTWHYFSSPPGLIVAGVYQHVALTYAKETGFAAIYLNGAQVAQQNLGTFTPLTTYDCYLGCGRLSGMPITWFGALHDLSIFARALTPAEIGNIYQANSAGKCATPIAPWLLNQPESKIYLAGSSVQLTVDAGGTGPLQYQWKKNGIDLADGGNVSGAPSRSLALNNFQPADEADYAVLVSNPYGTVLSSNAVLTLTYGSVILAWGDNTFGQTNVPSGLLDVRSISTGPDSTHSLALRANRTVVAWGDNSYGQSSVPPGLNDVIAIAAGGMHSLALKADGQVVGWGDNTLGQVDTPTGLVNVIGIAAGYAHSLALKADGTVVAWGDDSSGQITVPPGLANVFTLAAGYGHSLALRADGTVAAWGNNDWGQANVPAGLSDVTAIAAGDSHSLAVKADGTVVGWGYNGDGEADPPAGLNNVVAVAGGYTHSIALTADGQAVAWGWSLAGATQLPSVLKQASAVASGQNHSLALLNQSGPIILRPPLDQTVDPGAIVHLRVGAVGVEPLGFQWEKNGTNLDDSANVSGATSASLFLVDVQEADAASYRVVVSNVVGCVTSAPAFLSVLQRTGLRCVSDTLSTASNAPVVFAASKLAANDVDPDQFPLTVVTVSSNSVHGGNISLESGQVSYAPAGGFFGHDHFTYTISNGHGSIATGTVTVVVASPASIPMNIVFGPTIVEGNFVVRFAGIPGLTYSIEAAADVSGPWAKVQNIIVPDVDQGYGAGVVEFREPTGSNPVRFYRIVYPPH